MVLRHYKAAGKSGLFPLVYIPGFAASARSLHEVCEKLSAYTDVYALDLPGYQSPDESNLEDYTFDQFLFELSVLISREISGGFVLGGYSMGGRIALHYALKYPVDVQGLILESSSSGIDNEEERAKRKGSDDMLAEFILNHTANEFAEYWVNLPIFSTLSNIDKEKQALNFNEKQQNDRQALLLSLRLFGQGVMLPVTGLLPDLKIATLLMAGELDAKYLQINEQMSRLIPHNNYHRIAGCGHNIHLEKTGEFVNLVLSFLNQLKETK